MDTDKIRYILQQGEYGPIYAPSTQPAFIEGDVFRAVVPLPGAATYKSLSVNEGLNEGLKSLLSVIAQHPGIQAKKLYGLLSDRSLKTIERQVAQLAEKDLIERRGSRKTGGYYLKK